MPEDFDRVVIDVFSWDSHLIKGRILVEQESNQDKLSKIIQKRTENL